MLMWTQFQRPQHVLTATTTLLSVTIAAVLVQPAFALITGGEGNSPVNDPGWPKGAAAIFNHPARIAWWEGPPFGGGQWHAECRGDAKAFNAVLADFAKLDVKTKRVIVHDGVGRSFWLNPNREPAKQAAASIDWVFMVWQPANWEHLRKLPSDLNPVDARDADKGLPAQIDVYVGGNLGWSDVTVPNGLQVIDERLASMMQSARVRVTVDFTGTDRPGGYIVRMEPEGGAAVGKWSGSGNIDAQNQISFDDVPPGRYVLQGQPNPSRGHQQTKPLTIGLKGGQVAEITLSAK